MAPRVTLDLYTRACGLFLTTRPEASADKSNVRYTRRHTLNVLLLVVCVSVLVVCIRCAQQSSSPSGRAVVMRLTYKYKYSWQCRHYCPAVRHEIYSWLPPDPPMSGTKSK